MSRSKALDALVNKINKVQGDGTIVWGSEVSVDMVPRCTSGCLGLDLALGGGWPMNRHVEIVGDESSGKTALAMKTVAANQARDKNWTAVLLDAEDSYTSLWAQNLGVDTDRLIVVSGRGMETTYEIAIDFLKSREVDCVILDSLPALIPEREDDATMADLQVGLGALITGKYFRKQGPATRRSLTVAERPVLAIVINQWREKIGVLYGDPRTTPGGRAKNYSYHVRVEVRRDDWIEQGDRRVGQTLKFRVFKNKVAVPQKTALVDFYFDRCGDIRPGEFDTAKDILTVGMLNGVIEQRGSFYRYGENKWQGKAAAFEAIRSDEQLLEEISAAVLHRYRNPEIVPAPVEAEEVAAKRVVRRKKG